MLDQYNQSTRKFLSTFFQKEPVFSISENNQIKNPIPNNLYIYNFHTLKIYDTKFSPNNTSFHLLQNEKFPISRDERSSKGIILSFFPNTSSSIHSKYFPVRQLELYLHAGATFPGVLGRERASDRARSPPTLSASTSRRFPPFGEVWSGESGHVVR